MSRGCREILVPMTPAATIPDADRRAWVCTPWRNGLVVRAGLAVRVGLPGLTGLPFFESVCSGRLLRLTKLPVSDRRDLGVPYCPEEYSEPLSAAAVAGTMGTVTAGRGAGCRGEPLPLLSLPVTEEVSLPAERR